jgi:hypothetical protein
MPRLFYFLTAAILLLTPGLSMAQNDGQPGPVPRGCLEGCIQVLSQEGDLIDPGDLRECLGGCAQPMGYLPDNINMGECLDYCNRASGPCGDCCLDSQCYTDCSTAVYYCRFGCRYWFEDEAAGP